MTDFAITDFIPVYPKQDTESIQQIITAKKEFNELEASEKEDLKPGDFFKHQKIVMRYLREYDSLMIIHEAGTGKTCTFVSATEFFRKYSTLYRRAYILEKNDATGSDFKNQIMNVCAKGEFSRASEMEKWYVVTTYQKFVENELNAKQFRGNLGNLENIISKDEIIERFSDCIFLIDEAHNLRNSNNDVVDETDFVETDATDVSVFQIRVNLLKKLFREALRIKVVVSTATPMINRADEIITLLNLVLKEDLPEDIHTEDISELEPYLRGKISYVRALDTGIDLNYIGISRSEIDQEEEESVLKVVPLEMRSIQKDVTEYYSEKSGQFRNPQITASTFVFPYPHTPEQATKVNKEILDTKKKPYKISDAKVFEADGRLMSFKEYISNFERLKNLSAKFAFIVKNELRYAYEKGRLTPAKIEALRKQKIDFDDYEDYELENPIQQGNSFVYTSNVTAMGAIMLGLIMEAYGFTVFSQNDKDILTPEGNPSIEPKLRVAIFAESFTGVTRAALKVFGAPDNYDGKYLQCIVASRIARDGINLPNATRFYMAVPEWHYSGMYQAMSRIIRATSHETLKQKAREEGNNSRIDVNIYLLCAITENFSVDNLIYKENETKDREIREVMRKLKVIAVDCILNYKRNFRETDEDYSRDCDYIECEYQCYDAYDPPRIGGLADGQGPTPEDYDFSTYNILYADEMIERAKNFILEKIKIAGSITFDKIIEELVYQIREVEGKKEFHPIYIKRYVFEAVERQISSKEPFEDSYGYKSYLQTDDVNIFIQRDIPRKHNEFYGTVGLYNLQLVGIHRRNLNEIILKTSDKTSDILEEIINYNLENTEESERKFMRFFFESANTLSGVIDAMKKIIVLYYENNRKTPALKYLVEDYYSLYIYRFEKTTRALEGISGKLTSHKASVPADIFDDLDFTPTPGKWITIHLLKSNLSGFNKNIFYRPKISEEVMEIYEDGEWRECNRVEKVLYPWIFYCYYMESLSNVPEGELYLIETTVFEEDDPIIAVKTSLDNPGVSAREANRGAVCKNLQLSYIQNYLTMEEKNGLYPPRGNTWKDYFDNNDELRNKKRWCGVLRDHLIKLGRYIIHPPIYDGAL